jgi:AsmA protein
MRPPSSTGCSRPTSAVDGGHGAQADFVTRRLRIGLLVLAGLLVVLLLTALIATYVVLQPERFTAMLQSRAEAAGLDLGLASPASPTLWPKPALELDGLTLRARGSGTPLIVASRGELVLPWRTLLGGETTVSRLELEGARIDMDAVSAYLDTLPSQPTTAGAILPGIDAGFRVSRGTLTRGNRLLMSDVDIDAGRLANGRVFDLTLSALVDDKPYTMTLRTRPVLDGGVLTLGALQLDLASDDRFDATLRGSATWRGGADVGASLTGRVTRQDAKPLDIVLGMTPANEQDPLFVSMKVDGPTEHADLRVPPLAVAQWWTGINAGGTPTLPPLLGTVDAEAVDAGSVHITGLRIRATPDGAPVAAASTSTIAPAGSATATAPMPMPMPMPTPTPTPAGNKLPARAPAPAGTAP